IASFPHSPFMFPLIAGGGRSHYLVAVTRGGPDMRPKPARSSLTRAAGLAFAVAVLAGLDPRPVAPPRGATSVRPPLSFEANEGQTDPRVKFLSRGSGSTFFLTPGEAVLVVHRAAPFRPGGRGSKPDTLGPHAVLRMRLG